MYESFIFVFLFYFILFFFLFFFLKNKKNCFCFCYFVVFFIFNSEVIVDGNPGSGDLYLCSLSILYLWFSLIIGSE